MKKRIMSAAILIAIFVPLLMIGSWPFAIAIGVVSILAYKEVIDLKKKEKDLPSIIKILGMISLLLIIYFNKNDYFFNIGLSYKIIDIVLLLFLLPSVFYGKNNNYTTKDAFYLIGWTLLLGIFFNAIILIVNYNKLYLIYLLLITVLNDTFALIFGKLIGKNKLIPSISPNKTWEGTICGAILGTFIASVFYLNIINPNIALIKIVSITLMLSIIGQLGDLVFSKIKREEKVKDFSKIIPGHGGVLDRLDSLIFVVIAYLLIFTII